MSAIWPVLGLLGALVLIGGFFEALEPGFSKDVWKAMRETFKV